MCLLPLNDQGFGSELVESFRQLWVLQGNVEVRKELQGLASLFFYPFAWHPLYTFCVFLVVHLFSSSFCVFLFFNIYICISYMLIKRVRKCAYKKEKKCDPGNSFST